MISRVSSTLSVVCVTAAIRSGFWTADAARFFHAADQHDFAGRDAERALNFLVAGVADEDNGAAFVVVFLDFEMDLGDERAGGVDNAETRDPWRDPIRWARRHGR